MGYGRDSRCRTYRIESRAFRPNAGNSCATHCANNNSPTHCDAYTETRNFKHNHAARWHDANSSTQPVADPCGRKANAKYHTDGQADAGTASHSKSQWRRQDRAPTRRATTDT